MSEFEEMAVKFILRKIDRDVDYLDVLDWFDAYEAEGNETHDQIASITDGIFDAIRRVNNIEFRKS